MLKKQSLTRKKLAETRTTLSASNLESSTFTPPPFRVKTILPEVAPEPSSQTELKTTFQIHKERMAAAEKMLGSSMSNVSKDFIGTTSSKIWSPFEHGSRSSSIEMRKNYREELEIRKAAAAEIKAIGDAAKARVTKSGQKIKIKPPPKITTKKPELVQLIKARTPSPPVGVKRALAKKNLSGIVKTRKAPPATERKPRKEPPTSRRVPATERRALNTEPVSEPKAPTFIKVKPADREIVILGTKQKKKADVTLETIFGNDEASAIEDTQGPKEKKVLKKKILTKKPNPIGDVQGDSNEPHVSFATVLKRSSFIPPLRKNSATQRGARKSVTSMQVQDLSIVHGYLHVANEGAGPQINTFASPRDTRKSSGDDATKNAGRFQVDVNMVGFQDDEIFFQTDDTSLVVTGLRTKKPNANARKVTEVVEFPDGVYPESLRISRSTSGIITIEEY